jgi:hypothetical protein
MWGQKNITLYSEPDMAGISQVMTTFGVMNQKPAAMQLSN